MEKEIGRMKQKYFCREIILQESEDDEGRTILIREHDTSDKYTCFTKRWICIPEKKWPEFLDMVKKVKIPKT